MHLMTLPKYRPVIALSSAVLFIIFGLTNFIEMDIGVVLNGIDRNVLMMIAGTMGIGFIY